MRSSHKKLALLILSDLLILGSFGLIGPIFAIFIIGLEGGSIVAAGLCTTIYLVVKSSVQLPLSLYFIDKEKKKTHSLLLGTFLIISVPFIYYFAKNVYALYVAQAIYGLGGALAYPSWFTLFTNNLDRKHKGFEYAIYSTSIGIGAAVAAYFGAKAADVLGFKTLFFIVGLVALSGFLLLIILDRIDGNVRRKTASYVLKNRTKQ